MSGSCPELSGMVTRPEPDRRIYISLRDISVRPGCPLRVRERGDNVSGTGKKTGSSVPSQNDAITSARTVNQSWSCPLQALDKRLQSHGLRQRHCTGQQLKWMTAEEEHIARLTHKGGHHLPHG